ncbi:hypothetical protein I547_4634 [Mycobacterium kansasii 824]|nr:hypothetical protein I547_4634 [Mycobacterium kansasii 824]
MLPGPFQRFAEGRRAGLAEDWIMLSANKTRRVDAVCAMQSKR